MSPPATHRSLAIQLVRCLIVAAATATGVAFGCGPAESIGSANTTTAPAGDNRSTTQTSSTCPTAQVAYAEVAPIFARYCTSCHASTVRASARHGAPTGLNFDTYADASADAELAVGAVRSNMPPGQRLSHADTCTLSTWANEGAPQ